MDNGSSSRPDQSAEIEVAEVELRQVLAVLRRHWWLPVISAVLVVLGVWLWQRNDPPTYTAEALLRRQVERSPLDGLGSAIGGGRGEDAVAAQIEVLRSATVLGNVVDDVGLKLRWPSSAPLRTHVIAEATVGPPAAPGTFRLARSGNEIVLSAVPSGEELDRSRGGGVLHGPGFQLRLQEQADLEDAVDFTILHHQAAIERLRRGLALEQARATSLIRVRYTSPDPVHSAEVVNAVSEAYRAYSAAHARENARRRREFLAGQLGHMADSLSAAHQLQLDYQERAGIVNPQVEGQALILAVLDAEKDVRTLRYQETLLTTLNRALASPGEVDEALRRTVSLGRDLVPGAEGMFNRLQDLQTQRSRLTAGRFGYTESGREVEVLDSLIVLNKNEMRNLSGQALEVLGARRQAAEARLTELQAEVRALPGRSTGYLRLAQQAQAVQATYNLLAEKYYEAQIAEAVEGGDVEVVDYAVAPMLPDPSRLRFRLMLAFMFGGVVGTGGAFLLEYLDRTIRSAEDAERATGATVLASIPRLPGGIGAGGVARPVIVSDERTPGGEAFRTLRTMTHFSLADRPRVLAVSSPAPGEGKSTVAANLALTLAHEGKRVLLVDADLPRPMQHVIWDIPAEPGLTDVLVQRMKLEAAAHADLHNGLHVLSSGTPVRASSELVGSSAFRQFLEAAREDYDSVIIDAPPILVISDATVLGTIVDGMLVVARSNITDRHALADAVRQLRQVDAPLLGLVLNGVDRAAGYGGYGYGYGYGDYYARSNGSRGVVSGAANRVKRALARR